MDVSKELDELTARIARLPDDAQWELATRVFRRFGCLSQQEIQELQAAMAAEAQALLEWERANGKQPGDYRAAG